MSNEILAKHAIEDKAFNLYDVIYLLSFLAPIIMALYCTYMLAQPNLPRETASDLKIILGISGGVSFSKANKKD